MEDHEEIKIEIDPPMRMLLEERGIRGEDIRRVIAYAEQTQKIFRNSTTGHYLACHRASKITYWVEYGREGDFYRVFCAYSHRMEILEGFNMPATQKETVSEWLCVVCGTFVELATVKLTYLDETFAAETPACPSCHRILVSEADAVDKMALAEKMLEDK